MFYQNFYINANLQKRGLCDFHCKNLRASIFSYIYLRSNWIY